MMAMERVSRFVKNFVAALGHCVLSEALGPVLLLLAAVGALWLISATVQVTYEIVWDPNASDVAARLASLSIDPSKLG
jgi:Na+/H+ antiporter NhaA